jgi:hypothetical protein
LRPSYVGVERARFGPAAGIGDDGILVAERASDDAVST